MGIALVGKMGTYYLEIIRDPCQTNPLVVLCFQVNNVGTLYHFSGGQDLLGLNRFFPKHETVQRGGGGDDFSSIEKTKNV